METYLTMAKHVLDKGKDRGDRTGCGTRSVFGYQNRYDLRKGFPLLTTKRVNFNAVVEELLWFIRGETNIRSLQKANVKIWNEWADQEGNLGPVYGYQWRSWPNGKGGYIDQLEQVIDDIKRTPDSRRLLVNAWNVAQVPDMALPPCHTMFQFYVSEGTLSCQLYQRSGDVFLGVPFNIASYSLLTMLVAQACDLQPKEFIHTFGDLHIYSNHFEQVKTQLARKPYPLPTVELNSTVKDITAFTRQDIKLTNYQHHDKISAQVAV